MNKEEKTIGNQDDWQYLFKIFEQSWAYIRHAQTMFWQSFTALITAITGIIFFSYNNDKLLIKAIGAFSALILAIVGCFVVARILIVLREHFITINRIRRHCGIDAYEDIIFDRWKKGYECKDFRLWRPETRYILFVHQFYIFIFSGLIAYLVYIFYPSIRIAFIPSILSFILLQIDARKNVYLLSSHINRKQKGT